MAKEPSERERWYEGITRYQWLVLLIASLGWIFDVFEGQIFVASMREAIPSLVSGKTSEGRIALYNNIALAAFLLGGAIGGIVFGMLSDRIGRKRTMSLTILFYSLFTCVSAFSQQWWHLAGLRFLVAMGVGGEWAVASSMVAEVFPKKARAHVGSIFHASSVLGSYLAVAAGTFLIGNTAVHAWATGPSMSWVSSFMDPSSLPWRLGFALGVLPALLIIWIRMSLREPESWRAAREQATRAGQKLGAIGHLFRDQLLPRTLVGVSLASIGLATFWGVHIYGKDMLSEQIQRIYVPSQAKDQLQSVRREKLKDVLKQVREDIVAQSERAGRGIDTGLLDQLTVRALALFTSHDMANAKLAIQTHPADDGAETYELTAQWQQSLETDAGEAGEIPQANSSGQSRITLLTTDNPSEAELYRDLVVRTTTAITALIKRWEMLGMFLATTGGGIGLVCFGPICQRIGRRKTFLFYHLGGLVSALFVFQVFKDVNVLLLALPVFGFLTLGMHAGYAIYFPELYPTRLRATGAGFCFNSGRMLAAPILFAVGWMQNELGFSLHDAASFLSTLYLLAGVVLIFAPETKGQDLPD